MVEVVVVVVVVVVVIIGRTWRAWVYPFLTYDDMNMKLFLQGVLSYSEQSISDEA